MNLANPQPDLRPLAAVIKACIPEVARVTIQLYDDLKQERPEAGNVLAWCAAQTVTELQKQDANPYRVGALLTVALTVLVESVGGEQ